MRRPSPLTALPLLLAAALSLFAPSARCQVNPPRIPIVPVDPRTFDPDKLDTDPGEFAWQLFYYLDWPETPGKRGVPNPFRTIGQHGATVWESFKNITEVYLPKGARPPGWEVIAELPPIPLHKSHPTHAQFAALGHVDSTWIHYLSEPIMIDGQMICDSQSQNIHYEVRSNRDYFDYVVNNPSSYELFNMEGQLAARADANFTFNFPVPTLEIKASWRILASGDDSSRYWTAYGVYQDTSGNLIPARIGLTGIHVISRLRPNWVWMTFEQVDNPTTTFKILFHKKGAAIGPNPSYNTAMTPINQKWQTKLKDTKWQYYSLINVQTDFADTSGQPTLLSSTQMETYFQPQSSCITCHKLASIGNVQNPRLNFFGNHLLPYYGSIDFQSIANKQFPGVPFKDMDFAWSLKNANYKNPPPVDQK